MTFKQLKEILNQMNDADLSNEIHCFEEGQCDQMYIIRECTPTGMILRSGIIQDAIVDMEAALPLIYESWVKGGKQVETVEDHVNNMEGYDFKSFRERPWGVEWSYTVGDVHDFCELVFFTRYAGRSVKTELV